MPSYRSIRQYSSKMSKSLEKAFHKIANKDIKSYSNFYVMGYVVTFDTFSRRSNMGLSDYKEDPDRIRIKILLSVTSMRRS